jgi:hypothetical protein
VKGDLHRLDYRSVLPPPFLNLHGHTLVFLQPSWTHVCPSSTPPLNLPGHTPVLPQHAPHPSWTYISDAPFLDTGGAAGGVERGADAPRNRPLKYAPLPICLVSSPSGFCLSPPGFPRFNRGSAFALRRSTLDFCLGWQRLPFQHQTLNPTPKTLYPPNKGRGVRLARKSGLSFWLVAQPSKSAARRVKFGSGMSQRKSGTSVKSSHSGISWVTGERAERGEREFVRCLCATLKLTS